MGKSKVNVRSLHLGPRTMFFQERPSEFYLIIIWQRCFCAADTGGNYGNVTAIDDNGERKVSEERKKQQQKENIAEGDKNPFSYNKYR